jgi:predicted  nucleic acid-binding Zn-ribbon protein
MLSDTYHLKQENAQLRSQLATLERELKDARSEIERVQNEKWGVLGIARFWRNRKEARR